MKIFFAIVLLCTVALSTVSTVRAVAYVIHPPTINAQNIINVTSIIVPRGGVYVLSPVIDNTGGDVTINITIKGQACELGDPLVFFYRAALVGEAPSVIMNFPTAFFSISACGESVTSINLAIVERWAIQFVWDGHKFVNSQDLC
jgi:hypothetical protein